MIFRLHDFLLVFAGIVLNSSVGPFAKLSSADQWMREIFNDKVVSCKLML